MQVTVIDKVKRFGKFVEFNSFFSFLNYLLLSCIGCDTTGGTILVIFPFSSGRNTWKQSRTTFRSILLALLMCLKPPRKANDAQ